MSLPLPSEPLTRIRDAARAANRTSGRRRSPPRDLSLRPQIGIRGAPRRSCRTHSIWTSSSVDQLQSVVRSQLQRTAAALRRPGSSLPVPREQHVAATRLLIRCRWCSKPRGAAHRWPPASQHRPRRGRLTMTFRDLVAGVLRNAGFVVRTAANGLEALIAAYEMRPAVIVMDVTMPVLDGLEATRLIKAADATRHARVIAYTGDTTLSPSLVESLFAAVLHKPATSDVVVATVQQVASR